MVSYRRPRRERSAAELFALNFATMAKCLNARPKTTVSRPIIICGFPRTGTTFLQALLNSHPDIYISNEIRRRVLFAARFLCSQIVTIHRRRQEQWRNMDPGDAQACMLRAIWYYSEPQGYLSRRFGNRTPGNEHFFRFYDSIFSNAPPLYLYPIRDPAAALASYICAPWAGGPKLLPTLWRLWRSVQAAQRFHRFHPDRLLFVNLDRAITRNQRALVVNAVFRHVDENRTASVDSFSERWPLINAGESANSDMYKKLTLRISRQPIVRHLRHNLGYE